MFEIIKKTYLQSRNCLKRWNIYDDDAEQYLNREFIKFVSVLLRLNYVNQWQLSKKERLTLTQKMLNDETTVAACRTVPEGKMDKIIRLVVRSRSVTLANGFSAGTILYQKVRRKES